jgi:hypothetical protein
MSRPASAASSVVGTAPNASDDDICVDHAPFGQNDPRAAARRFDCFDANAEHDLNSLALMSRRDGGGERFRRRAAKQARISFEDNDLASHRARGGCKFQPDKTATYDRDASCAAEPIPNG